MNRSRARTASGIGLILVLAAAAGGTGYAETRAARSPVSAHHAGAVAAASSTPAALAGATAAPASAAPSSAGLSSGSEPQPGALSTALARVLRAPGLGGRLRARVVDVASGRVLLNRGGAAPAAPASTAKLLVAAAVLTVHRPTDRITTSVVRGPRGSVVLVGGGDPTLTGAAKPSGAAYPHAASIAELARQVRTEHVRPTRIVVDDSAFTGPTISPAWAGDDVPSSYASAITAVMSDGGRAGPGAVIRSAQPDLAAGHELAAALERPNLSVVRGRAPAHAAPLASVRSATFATLVDQMLLESDNVIAEALGRQVALAVGQPVSFVGAAAAIRLVLSRLGVRVGAGMLDASGLAAGDRLTVDGLTGALQVIASGQHPSLGDVLAGLPVAGWSGTLDDRYLTGPARSGAGVIRAKTGTLTGVSSLAGLVHDRSGRLLAFALIADRTGSTPAAEAALDRVAADLAGCGCT